jgi:hypothetical protein
LNSRDESLYANAVAQKHIAEDLVVYISRNVIEKIDHAAGLRVLHCYPGRAELCAWRCGTMSGTQELASIGRPRIRTIEHELNISTVDAVANLLRNVRCRSDHRTRNDTQYSDVIPHKLELIGRWLLEIDLLEN